MATTSIWAVKGWLGKVVLYIENPEKTENPQFYRQKNMTDVQVQNLSDVIDYAARLDKTTEALDSESVSVLRQLVSGINCLPATARDEMLAVKKRFGKEDGVVAYHGYQSFAPGEATPELAHEIGVKLARKLWGEKYQVLVSTHLDKENHLHSHFVVNTVSFVDGIRYHRTGKDYYEMRTVSDELCREYGLSVVEKPQLGKSKHYGEWRAEQEQRPTWRGLIRSEIDELIRESVSEKQFYYLLRQKGYAVKFGKDISVRPPGKERFVRLARNFGAAYTEDGIRRRILSQPLPQVPHPEAPKERKKVYSMGKWQKMRKITGFRALYLYYCYKLGVFPKRRPQNRARLHFLLREDLIKLNTECGAMVQFQCLHYFFYGQLTLIQYFHQSKDLVGAWSVLGRCLVGAWSVCNLTFEYQRYTVRPYPVFRFGQSGFATLGHHQSYAASPAFQNLPLVQDIGQQWILWFRFML